MHKQIIRGISLNCINLFDSRAVADILVRPLGLQHLLDHVLVAVAVLPLVSKSKRCHVTRIVH